MVSADSGVQAVVDKICLIASRVAGVILMFLVLVLVADVFGRFVGYPVLGSYEIVQYGFALVVCLSIGYAAVEGAHIVIDLLFGALPKGLQRVCIWVSDVLSILMFALITWRLAADALESYRISERSSTLNIPVSIFGFALAAGFGLLALVIILQFIKSMGAK